MESSHKLIIIVFGTEQYDTDAPLRALAAKLKSLNVFMVSEEKGSFLMGDLNGIKVAVISDKNAESNVLERLLQKADIFGCERIFVSTPHHNYRFNTVSEFAANNNYLRVETSPTVVKSFDWNNSLKPFQESLDCMFGGMLYNMI
ncbi:MAG: hypothetical protein K2H96_10930 [Muribaculaceae bacterium]|nr:hypothetical protein [Muribaculaceae bacterium]